MKLLQSIMAIYKKRGFMIKRVLPDVQFKPWRQELNSRSIELNIVSNDEHVGDMDMYIRTTIERGRVTYNSLPYTQFGLPMIMVI